MSYEPDDIEAVFTGVEYQFGFDLDGTLHGITKPECRICRCYWGPVIDEDEDDQYGRDFHAFIASREAEIKRLNQILTDPQTLHLHILRNPEVLPANLLRHLLGTDKEVTTSA